MLHLPPLKHPLHRAVRPSPLRHPVRLASTSIDRKTASFYISNVFPVKLAYWDPRPTWASLREEYLMERLHDISSDVTGHGFRIESMEIARKDGGVFMHFSYLPPNPSDEAAVEKDLSSISSMPEVVAPSSLSPGRLFLSQLVESAKKRGGFPSWLGQWWANRWEGRGGVPGHRLYSAGGGTRIDGEGGGTLVKGSGSGMTGIQAAAGDGRVWVVKGRQWTEVSEEHLDTSMLLQDLYLTLMAQDMNRFPSNRLRVEFDGPDVSQEMLYTLFRVSRLIRLALKIAIWSTGGYPASFTGPFRLSPLRLRSLLQDLTCRHSHQLRRSRYLD